MLPQGRGLFPDTSGTPWQAALPRAALHDSACACDPPRCAVQAGAWAQRGASREEKETLMQRAPCSPAPQHPEAPTPTLPPGPLGYNPKIGNPKGFCRHSPSSHIKIFPLLRAKLHRLPGASGLVCVYICQLSRQWLSHVSQAWPPTQLFSLFSETKQSQACQSQEGVSGKHLGWLGRGRPCPWLPGGLCVALRGQPAPSP